MKVKTWMDAITDESNLWINAVRSEDAEDYYHAFLSYLEDAQTCLTNGSLVRAAMSCSCAADCLASLGYPGDAKLLYRESASLYEENAQFSVRHSIRESSWSLLQSYEYYALVSDESGAERVSKKYVELAGKIDQFEGKARALNILTSRSKKVRDFRMNLEGAKAENGSDTRLQGNIFAVRKVASNFLETLRSRHSKTFLKKVPSIAQTGADFRYEGSIVS